MALQWVSDTGLVANEIARVLEKSGIAELAIMVAGSFSELKTARKVAQLPQAETYMPTTAQWVNGFKQSGLSLQRVITEGLCRYSLRYYVAIALCERGGGR